MSLLRVFNLLLGLAKFIKTNHDELKVVLG